MSYEQLAIKLEESFKHYLKIYYENNVFIYKINTDDIEFGNKLVEIYKYVLDKYFSLFSKGENTAKNFLNFVCILIKNSLKEMRKYPEYRLGQAIFNESYRILNHNLAGSENDCFYKDDKIINFLEELSKIC